MGGNYLKWHLEVDPAPMVLAYSLAREIWMMPEFSILTAKDLLHILVRPLSIQNTTAKSNEKKIKSKSIQMIKRLGLHI